MHHHESSRDRRIAGAALLALAVGSFGLPAPVAAAEAVPTSADCTSVASEWARCATVAATLSKAPAVGQQARLSITVDTQIPVDDLTVRVALPAPLTWATVPTGFTKAGTASKRPSDLGSVSTITAKVAAVPGRTQRFEADVTAVAAGATVLRAQATSARGPEYGSTEFHLPLTIGASAQQSRLGLSESDVAKASPPGTVAVPAYPSVPYRPASTAHLPKPFSDDPPAAPGAAIEQPTCVTATLIYADNTGAPHPSKNLQYQVWDEDLLGDDLLASGLADAQGSFRACFSNNDGLGGGGQDVYLRAVTEGSQYKVENDDDDPYQYDTATRNNVGTGRTIGFGTLQPTNAAQMPAYHAFDTADTAAAWTPGDCWDDRDTNCQNIDIEWEPGINRGAFYDPGSDEVRLGAPDPAEPWVVIHELGHGVMDDVYEDNMPPSEQPACRTHFVNQQSGPICAWVEGFADWYGTAVLNNPDIPGNRGNIDTATWGTPGWNDGDQVEGRVAGSLWDLLDTTDDGTDTYNDTLANVWDTFLNGRVTTFAAYWAARGREGKQVGDPALGSLFQNTIDYGFRQPLTSGAAVQGTTPPNDHNYRYDTQHQAWSVVAVRPPTGADDDLRLYDDRALTQLLGTSAIGTDTVDFLAVNSSPGHRPLGDYYPQVRRLAGTGAYTVQLFDTGELLTGTATRQLGAGDVVTSWTSCLTANQQVTFTVTPGAATQDPELFVVESGGAEPDVKSRGAATAATPAGPGQPEQVGYTAPADGCVGVIVVNKAGAGTYTVTRS
ncbi:hypothetical protein [Paractinoplanes maris]|uniref:hypothetical protein n=1 Tax=Paractinoplanes maris TaxID=1734446 RepID=UPI0020224A48|nr:hypothetical protein [Actinoplanes maris]